MLEPSGPSPSTTASDPGGGDRRSPALRVAQCRDLVAVAAWWRRSVGLLADGRVVAAGRVVELACEVFSWREVVAVAAGDWNTVGVRADGTALATGVGRFGQCDVRRWRGLADVSAGYLHTRRSPW